jgi:hypothetical protein
MQKPEACMKVECVRNSLEFVNVSQAPSYNLNCICFTFKNNYHYLFYFDILNCWRVVASTKQMNQTNCNTENQSMVITQICWEEGSPLCWNYQPFWASKIPHHQRHVCIFPQVPHGIFSKQFTEWPVHCNLSIVQSQGYTQDGSENRCDKSKKCCTISQIEDYNPNNFFLDTWVAPYYELGNMSETC